MNARLAIILRRVATHRLVHFACIAAALFALTPGEHGGTKDIKITRDQLVTLYEKEARLGNGSLSPEDKQRALDAFLQEEILYREGLRLGLDRDDPVVRGRIVRKMAAYAEDVGGTATPLTEAAVVAHYKAHMEKWRDPSRARIDWIFVTKSDGGNARVAQIQDVLAQDPDRSVASLSDEAPLAHDNAWTTEQDLTRVVGSKVSDAVFRGPLGTWSAPVASSYGFYLVRVKAREEERVADLEGARARVVADIGHERTERGADAFFARAASSYRVHVDAPPGDDVAPSLHFSRPALRAMGPR